METYKGDAFILSHNIVYHESFTAGADATLAERIVALLLNAGKRALIDESIVDEEPLTDGLKLVGLQIDDKTYYVFPLEVREEMYFGVMTCVHEILDSLNEIHYGEPDEIQQPE